MILKILLRVIAATILSIFILSCICVGVVDPNHESESRRFWILTIELALIRAVALIGGLYPTRLLESILYNN